MSNAGLPSADELTTRIVRCIGIWETNRGKDQPAPKESALNTVAGLPASMATVEQATMPYAVDALKNHPELRSLAAPPLTKAELDAAGARCTAVDALFKAIAKTTQTQAAFVAAQASAVAATGLSADNITTMFASAALKKKIDALAAQVAAKTMTVAAAIASLAPADRLGLGEGSLKTYINRPNTWGENRAAWQRKAVGLMADGVGARIEAVAVAKNGTAFITPVVAARVAKQLAQTPKPSEQQIVVTVGGQNNAGEPGYGQNIWANYKRLYA